MSIIETHSARNPRLLTFYALLAAMLLVLTTGLAYRQLFKSGLYSERERIQNQRRVLYPGPRGNIYDRDGRLLVGNQPRLSVQLDLAELRDAFDHEAVRIRRNYAAFPQDERPSYHQRYLMARVAVVQRYLDQVNTLIGRSEAVSSREIERHYSRSLLIPFVLLDDLAPEEYARLIEQLPVNSPLQVYASSNRHYPFGSAAAHTLGYVGVSNDIDSVDIPGEDLMTFKMRGNFGRDGLERAFDELLQGDAGGAIYRVDPAGFKVDDPIEMLLPRQGTDLTSSLDIDLQLAAEEAMEGKVGAAVAIDVRTGEVLVLASKPDYNLNDFVPRLSTTVARKIEEDGAWLNRAIQGAYPAGSTFKLVTAFAGLRAAAIDRTRSKTICPGFLQVGNRRFPCNSRIGHGERDLTGAIADSCNVFFYKYGVEMGAPLIAAEARRFQYDKPTGIELPGESSRMLVGDPEWKREHFKDSWYPGDTANMSIGQGFLDVTPLQIACFAASIARRETVTHPYVLHDPNRPRQKSAPIGISDDDYQAVIAGMEQAAREGTAKLVKVDNLRIAAKTGTAQKRTPQGTLELAWLAAFAPVENPQIAIAVVMESPEVDMNYGGGLHAAPVAHSILYTWEEKRRLGPSVAAPAAFRINTE